MFVTVNNGDTFAKLIFTSDTQLAQQINIEAVRHGYNRVSYPETMGGYTYPIIEDIAKGEHFCIVTSEFPKTASEKIRYEKILNDPDTLYSIVDASKVFYVQIANGASNRQRLTDAGWTINWYKGSKTSKRAKTLHRPFRWVNRLNRELRVYIIPDDGYSNIDEGLLDTIDTQLLLDGAFIINGDLVDECRNNIAFQVKNETTDPALSFDWMRQQHYLRKSMDFRSYNGRIFGPMTFCGDDAGDPFFDVPRSIKGEAYARYDLPDYFKDIDIICARSAFKPEVYNSIQSYILLEPQNPKLSANEIEVWSDAQTITNNPALFQVADVMEHLKIWLADMMDHLKSGKLLESWYNPASAVIQTSSANHTEDVNTLMKWVARAWTMSGMNYTQSPWMFKHIAKLIVAALRPDDRSSLRFPIPCAMRVFVISSSLASAYCSGEDDFEERLPQPGQIRYLEEMRTLVVHDSDWIEMLPSHGGCDLDDFFTAFYRTIGGEKKVILTRSPNDWGEYTVFDYVEGDYYPAWVQANGNSIEFPVLKSELIDKTLWPQRLSEAQANKDVIYQELPSVHIKRTDEAAGIAPPQVVPYGPSHVDWQIANCSSAAASVGQNVNARMLWSMVCAPHVGHRPIQLCTLESAIDAGTQGGLSGDVEAVIDEASAIIFGVMTEYIFPVDYFLWSSRFQNFYGTLPPGRVDMNGRLTKLYQLRKEASVVFVTKAEAWAAVNCKIPTIVHTLGLVRLAHARHVLMMCRTRMWNLQSSGDLTLEPEQWSVIHQPIFDYIGKCEQPTDVHDFMLSLWSACIKFPTSSGQITDQAVMNPQVFTYLLEALRYYGIADHIEYDDQDQLVRHRDEAWELQCTDCGYLIITEKRKDLQIYNINRGVCRPCRELRTAAVVIEEVVGV